MTGTSWLRVDLWVGACVCLKYLTFVWVWSKILCYFTCCARLCNDYIFFNFFDCIHDHTFTVFFVFSHRTLSFDVRHWRFELHFSPMHCRLIYIADVSCMAWMMMQFSVMLILFMYCIYILFNIFLQFSVTAYWRLTVLQFFVTAYWRFALRFPPILCRLM